MSVASRSSFCLCVPDDAYQARGEESVRDATVQLQERDENDPGWPWKNTDDATASLRRVPELQVGSSFHECPHFSCANKRRRCCRRTSCWWNFVCSYWQRRTHWLFTLYAVLLVDWSLRGTTRVHSSFSFPKNSERVYWLVLVERLGAFWLIEASSSSFQESTAGGNRCQKVWHVLWTYGLWSKQRSRTISSAVVIVNCFVRSTHTAAAAAASTADGWHRKVSFSGFRFMHVTPSLTWNEQ